MKRKTALLALLISLSILLPSCISSSIIRLETLPPEESRENPTSAPTEELAPVVGGIWSDEQALAAAELMLRHPTGGVVDISKSAYSYDEMVADLQNLAKIYPRYFRCGVIGTSVAGRELYVGVLGNPNAPKQVVVTAAIHAREYLTALLVMKQLEFYLQSYTKGSYKGISYSTLFEECCFYIVPMVNPDGVMMAQEGLPSLPLTLQTKILNIYETEQHSYESVSAFLACWKANANGVDLNRNYDALWDEYNKTGVPASSQYKGPSPASEPETQAMVSLISSLPNVVCSLCIHSQGEVIYWNCGQKGEAAAATRAFAGAVSRLNGYYVVPEQNNDASLSDWCELKLGVVAITVETGNVACPLPIEQFHDIFLDNYLLWAMTALYF